MTTATCSRIEFEGVVLTVQHNGFSDHAYGQVWFPSGERRTYEADRDCRHGILACRDATFRTEEDRIIADRLFPSDGRFRRPSAELTVAAWAAVDVPGRKPETSPVRVPVPALADIAAACDAEGTPLLFPRGPRARTCHECGSAIHGESCTHCHES